MRHSHSHSILTLPLVRESDMHLHSTHFTPCRQPPSIPTHPPHLPRRRWWVDFQGQVAHVVSLIEVVHGDGDLVGALLGVEEVVAVDLGVRV